MYYWIKFWLFMLMFIAGLGAVIGWRGQDAMAGVLWGVKPTVCGWDQLAHNSACGLRPDTMRVNLGVYDFEQKFNQEIPGIALQHYYVDWRKFSEQEWKSWLDLTKVTKRWILLTIEPWTDRGASLFEEILSGQFDREIVGICQGIETSPNPIFVRWGHEMENLTGRYPWARDDFEGYKAAFRHVVTTCRSVTDNAFYVWSPVGNSGLDHYWPGNEYVDYVGLSVYGYQNWEIAYYDKALSFSETFKPKYDRVVKFGKPIMIAELGVEGDREYEYRWLEELFQQADSYAALKSVVYFYAKDTEGVWGEGIPTPDWTIPVEWWK